MSRAIISGFLCLILAAGAVGAGGGEPAKEGPFRELASEELGPLLGDWEATINTTFGWKGTLRANITSKRNHPEVSEFHALVALHYNLRYVVDKKTPAVVVKGSEKRAMIPWQTDKHRYVQLLRETQVLQKVFFEDVLDIRPMDKAALKGLADLQPSRRDTAAIAIANDRWTLAFSPAVAEILPRKGASGPRIDWDSQIAWRKARSK
jgi:hypothetical protein